MAIRNALFKRSVQDLRIIPGPGSIQRFAGERRARSVRQRGKVKAVRAQSLIFELQFPVGRVVPVFAVSKDRAADGGQMRAYLMCAPRDEFNLQQSQPSADSQRFIFCHNIFCSGRGCVQNTHTRLSGVLLQIAAQCCCRRRGASKGDAEVFFFDHTLFYKVQQKRFSLLRLGNEHKTGRADGRGAESSRVPAHIRLCDTGTGERG